MSHVIKFIDDELGPILIEVDRVETGDEWSNISRDEGETVEVEGKFEKAFSNLKKFATGTFKALKSLQPDEIQIKGGVKFKYSEGKLISWFAQAGAEFPLEVTMKWKLDKAQNNNEANPESIK